MGYEFPRDYYLSKSKVNPMMNHVLFRACLVGHEKIVWWALDQGADPRTIKRTGLHSALDRAALNGYEAIVRLLLETHKQRSAEEINNFWQRHCLNRSLVLAARRGWLGIAQLLIDHGAHVNPVADGIPWCGYNDIPLISVVKCGGQVEMVSLLLRNGATTEDRLKKGDCTIRELILSLALQHGYTSIQDIFKSE
jgi:ankyrin repeat protein